MTQDVLLIAMLDVSGAARAGNGSPRPADRVYASATSVRCVDVGIIFSEVGCGRGSECPQPGYGIAHHAGGFAIIKTPDPEAHDHLLRGVDFCTTLPNGQA
eukprot:CAMPEP_0185826632 /NCGR_PEP_ID=MMETSP1322-20130828/31644_1 /TAXON_ID=265543 /ORGANISM="Minutocellus polymorphus, Strain RCC2270" /LENGTH=100 /DNA_ID=CAMNT_0028524361 /DNA_START=891 /DNA_END=1193 /DNA_ORIENTATION=+